MPDLRLPGAVIARDSWTKNHRNAASGLLVIEPDPSSAVTCGMASPVGFPLEFFRATGS